MVSKLAKTGFREGWGHFPAYMVVRMAMERRRIVTMKESWGGDNEEDEEDEEAKSITKHQRKTYIIHKSYFDDNDDNGDEVVIGSVGLWGFPTSSSQSHVESLPFLGLSNVAVPLTLLDHNLRGNYHQHSCKPTSRQVRSLSWNVLFLFLQLRLKFYFHQKLGENQPGN